MGLLLGLAKEPMEKFLEKKKEKALRKREKMKRNIAENPSQISGVMKKGGKVSKAKKKKVKKNGAPHNRLY